MRIVIFCITPEQGIYKIQIPKEIKKFKGSSVIKVATMKIWMVLHALIFVSITLLFQLCSNHTNSKLLCLAVIKYEGISQSLENSVKQIIL